MALNVDQLRTELLKAGMSEEEVARMSKKELNQKYMETIQEEVEITFEKPEKSDGPNTMEEALNIKYGTPEWQAFIMGELRPDELLDGCPRCNGLRRVAQLYLGDIVKTGAKEVFITPGPIDRVVTINYEIVFDWKLSRYVGYTDAYQGNSELRTFGGVADCSADNSIYGKHPSATAETKAESRALRKALSLNVVTAEEKVTGQDNELPKAKSGDRITAPLKNMIESKLQIFNVSPTIALSAFGITDNRGIKDLNMEEARSMFDFVNTTYQSNKD
jgi:hypothetical protein